MARFVLLFYPKEIMIGKPDANTSRPRLLDVVALLSDLPECGLRAGQVGTIVEVLAPGVFEVEFADPEGRAFEITPVRAGQVLVLHYGPLAATA